MFILHAPSFRLRGMKPGFPAALLWIPEATALGLLELYDYPHPYQCGVTIDGYDKAHALRTAKMCAAVAQYLGHDHKRVTDYQAACVLHDLGRAGLDAPVFGKIWSWAREHNVPTRPAEWRAQYPDTVYGQETEAFLAMYQSQLQDLDLPLDSWTVEQIEMRLGYSRRLKRIVARLKPTLQRLGYNWFPWMEQVVLYYYYPEQLDSAPGWVRELGEVLVACEQLEAYSNRDRGTVYYNREQERFSEAFDYLDGLKTKGQLGAKVLNAVRLLVAEGIFDDILTSARKQPLSPADLRYLRTLKPN